MLILGYILLSAGLLAALYGEVRFLVVAYKQSLWWFFGCLFVPLADWAFFLLNLKATIKPVACSLLGFVVAGVGGALAGISFPS